MTCAKKSPMGVPRKLPPLNALRAFEAAGRHQSFSRAAQELGVSHSAISRHVRGLETRLNAQLFRDFSRGVELTKAGARYLSEISPALDQIAAATEEFAARPTGRVLVNSEPVFATRWLIQRMAGFHQAYPEIDLRLDASQDLVDIARYEADLAIRFYKKGIADEGSVLISNAPLYPYISPDLRADPFEKVEELLDYRLLQERKGSVWADWFREAGSTIDVPEPDWRMRAVLALETALAGQGVILASSEIVEVDVRAGRLVCCFDIPLQLGSYNLLFGEGAQRRRAVRLFRDWLLAETASLRNI